jgi:outer membrane protein OmpA-like peptidoglycan-associated protein
VVYQSGDEWIVAVAADRLFSQSGSQLLTQGAARLDEVANVVKEKFKKEVTVYVYSEQEQLSAERCNVIRAEIARRVVIPTEVFKVVPRFVPGLTPKYSKVEVHIL